MRRRSRTSRTSICARCSDTSLACRFADDRGRESSERSTAPKGANPARARCRPPPNEHSRLPRCVDARQRAPGDDRPPRQESLVSPKGNTTSASPFQSISLPVRPRDIVIARHSRPPPVRQSRAASAWTAQATVVVTLMAAPSREAAPAEAASACRGACPRRRPRARRRPRSIVAMRAWTRHLPRRDEVSDRLRAEPLEEKGGAQ